MGLQTTTKNNIITIHGNGLAVFLLDDNKLYLKDSNGATAPISDFISGNITVNWGSILGTLSAQTDLQDALDLKANIASPTFTGTVSGIDKTMVGLGNVDNTSDLNKPISTATQTVLDLKLNNTTDTFTGALTVTQDVIANAFVKTGGTSSQFLKADGTIDGAAYVPFASYTAADVLSKLLTVDGSGSGLDADLLDGVNSGSFLRSDVPDTKTSGALFFSDSVELIFGTGNDMRFGHDGTFNNLKLFNADFRILHDNTTRFTFGRTSGDFTATGTATATSFNSTAASGYSIGGNVIADLSANILSLGDVSNTSTSVNIIGPNPSYGITLTDDTTEIFASENIILHNDLQIPESNINVQGSGEVRAGQYRINALQTAPATATSPGSLGEIRYTADYIYVCIATNTWVRADLVTW
jgi:hypothetical protein